MSLSCRPVLVMRCKALRIKTSFNLGQHPIIPFTGQKQPPCWAAEEGTRLVPRMRLKLKMSSPLSAEETS